MKKTLLVLALMLCGAFSAHATTIAAVLQLGGIPSPDPAYKAVNAGYTISDSVAQTQIPETSADNILLPPDAAPILLDFGAARRVISDRTQSLTAILKPSYAPIEQ